MSSETVQLSLTHHVGGQFPLEAKLWYDQIDSIGRARKATILVHNVPGYTANFPEHDWSTIGDTLPRNIVGIRFQFRKPTRPNADRTLPNVESVRTLMDTLIHRVPRIRVVECFDASQEYLRTLFLAPVEETHASKDPNIAIRRIRISGTDFHDMEIAHLARIVPGLKLLDLILPETMESFPPDPIPPPDYSPLREAISTSQTLENLRLGTYIPPELIPNPFPERIKYLYLHAEDTIDSAILEILRTSELSKLENLSLREDGLNDRTNSQTYGRLIRMLPMPRIRALRKLKFGTTEDRVKEVLVWLGAVLSAPNSLETFGLYHSHVPIRLLQYVLRAKQCHLQAMYVRWIEMGRYHDLPRQHEIEGFRTLFREIRSQTRLHTFKITLTPRTYGVSTRELPLDSFEAMNGPWFRIVQILLSVRYIPRLTLLPPSPQTATTTALVSEIPWTDYIPQIARTLGWPMDKMEFPPPT